MPKHSRKKKRSRSSSQKDEKILKILKRLEKRVSRIEEKQPPKSFPKAKPRLTRRIRVISSDSETGSDADEHSSERRSDSDKYEFSVGNY